MPYSSNPSVWPTYLQLGLEVVSIIHLDGVLVERVTEQVELQEAQGDCLAWLHTADDFDAVDRLEGILVVKQQAILHVNQLLRRAHAHQAEHVVRDTADADNHLDN